MIDTLVADLVDLGEPALRIALVLVSGGLIGWDRELTEKSAGLRTHTMVGLGSALFAILAERILAGPHSTGDPSRIMAGIAQGIGFLGAGTILKERERIIGLTTAATIWLMGALGIAWGVGEYGIGALATVAALIVLRPFKQLERIAHERCSARRLRDAGVAPEGDEVDE